VSYASAEALCDSVAATREISGRIEPGDVGKRSQNNDTQVTKV